MRVLQKILMMSAMAAVLSFGAPAQKKDDKTPKKPPPPVIKPGEKPKDDKPKKPNSALIAEYPELLQLR